MNMFKQEFQIKVKIDSDLNNSDLNNIRTIIQTPSLNFFKIRIIFLQFYIILRKAKIRNESNIKQW